MENLIGRPEHAELENRLAAGLDNWLAITGDRFLPGEDHLREMGLVDAWNSRELSLHPGNPRLIKKD